VADHVTRSALPPPEPEPTAPDHVPERSAGEAEGDIAEPPQPEAVVINAPTKTAALIRLSMFAFGLLDRSQTTKIFQAYLSRPTGHCCAARVHIVSSGSIARTTAVRSSSQPSTGSDDQGRPA